VNSPGRNRSGFGEAAAPSDCVQHESTGAHEPGVQPAVSLGRAKALAGCKTNYVDDIEVDDTGALPVAIVVSGTGLRRLARGCGDCRRR